MNTFTKWIIFILFFAFAENSPTTTSPHHEYDVTETLNSIIANIFKSFEWKTVYFHVRNNTDNNFTTTVKSYDVQLENGIHFYNVTSKFQSSPSLKIRLLFYDNLTAICEMVSVSLKAYLPNINQHIATEPIPFNFTLNLPTLQSKDDSKKAVTVEYHHLDQYDIKLLASDYQYKPDQENQIKQALKTYLKTTLYEKVNQEWKISLLFLGYTFLRGLGQKSAIVSNHDDFLQNEQKHYYFIGTIPSNDYTLTNVTIKGLWNFRSIQLDFSNPAAFPEIQISNVQGTLVQNLPSGVEKSLQLSFKIDNIFASADQEAGKINIKSVGYFVKNTKSNTSLTSDQSKIIVERIESAIAALIWTSMNNF